MTYVPLDEQVFERAIEDKLTWADYEVAVKNVAENMPKWKILLPLNTDGK